MQPPHQDRTVRWIATTAELEAELDRIAEGPLALDSEADSFHHYREKVCLLQLSFGDRDLLVDTLSGIDLSCLRPVLENPALRKILHGADYDIRVLDRDFGLHISGLFDTMIAARLAGERAFGLAALLDSRFGVRLDKKHQRADWSRRPLTEDMKRYAVMDTRYLEPLMLELEAGLQGLGRTAWASEEFERMERVRWSDPKAGKPGYLRIKGAQKLRGRELAVLREVYEVREQAAQRRDVPTFRIMNDEVLLRLACEQPRDVASLSRVPSLPRPWSSDRRAGRILDAVGRGLALAEADLPSLPDLPRRRRDPARERLLRQMRTRRDALAGRLGLDPSLLAPRAVLSEALEGLQEGRDLSGVAGLRRWQAELLERDLREVAGASDFGEGSDVPTGE